MPAPGKKMHARTLAVHQRFGDTRRAWLETFQMKVTLYLGSVADPKELAVPEMDRESGKFGHKNDSVTLAFQRQGTRSVYILSLAALTYDELCATKELFDIAFAEAQGVTQERDREAWEAYDEGDTSYNRVYRQVPRIIVREGEVFGHRAKLRKRSDWVTRVESFVQSHATRFRVGSGPVPERIQAGTEGSGTQDDGPETG